MEDVEVKDAVGSSVSLFVDVVGQKGPGEAAKSELAELAQVAGAFDAGLSKIDYELPLTGAQKARERAAKLAKETSAKAQAVAGRAAARFGQALEQAEAELTDWPEPKNAEELRRPFRGLDQLAMRAVLSEVSDEQLAALFHAPKQPRPRPGVTRSKLPVMLPVVEPDVLREEIARRRPEAAQRADYLRAAKAAAESWGNFVSRQVIAHLGKRGLDLGVVLR